MSQDSLNPPGGRRRYAKPKTLDELAQRLRPFVRYLRQCGMDEVSSEVEAALDGDAAEDLTDGFGTTLLPENLP
jgi:hypothetical protein